MPVVSSIVAVFILVTEGRSIWEKADAKQRRQAAKSIDLLSSIVSKESIKEAFTQALIEAKDKEDKEYGRCE